MKTVLVEVKDNAGMRILQELEQAQLIRLVETSGEKSPQRLSARLRGSISKETVQQMQSELKQMRGEWQQGI